MPKAKRGLYWGRFNPPHNGHLQVIEHLLEKECDELVVAIGSCLASHTPRNPFTGGERLEMIRAMLAEAKIDSKVIVVQVPDADTYQSTAGNLTLVSPPFDVVFTNRKVIASIFSKWGFEVKSFPFFERGKYSSTAVREALVKQKNFSSFVPASVHRWLYQHDGAKRLQDVHDDQYAGE